jgi:hypothetical protein
MIKFFRTLSAALVILVASFAIGARMAQAMPGRSAPDLLPYGLTMRDTRATVEERFGYPRVTYAPQAGWEPGLPDEGGSPDHMTYWAIYRRFGVIVIYNSPSPDDKNATIRSILVND